jgi:hypothetical protein
MCSQEIKAATIEEPLPPGIAMDSRDHGLVGQATMRLAGVFLTAGIGVFGYQCLLWLRDGYWTPLELRLAWEWLGGSEPYFPQWQGVQKIVVGFFDLPLMTGLLAAGILILWCAFWLSERRRARDLVLGDDEADDPRD